MFRAELGNFGDCELVGEGFRRCGFITGRATACISQRGGEAVILVAGGDKSTQAKDIKTALKLAREL